MILVSPVNKNDGETKNKFCISPLKLNLATSPKSNEAESDGSPKSINSFDMMAAKKNRYSNYTHRNYLNSNTQSFSPIKHNTLKKIP